MVLQQCLACNSSITGSSRSCACGHVFEDPSRFIGGKRFSEYRAMLYSRLEKRKKKKEERERRGIQQQSFRDIKNQLQVALKEERPQYTPTEDRPQYTPTEKRRSTPVSRTSNKMQRRKKSSLKDQHKKSSKVPQELLSRLPSALQGINRKIMGQNMLWLAIQME